MFPIRQPEPRFLLKIAPPFGLLAILLLPLLGTPVIRAAIAQKSRLVVVLYPEANDGSPGSILADQSIRATFSAGSPQPVEIHNEYLDISRFPDAGYQRDLAAFLHRKYQGRHVDLVLVGLASAFNYALEHRGELFPGVPLVFFAVDQQGINTQRLDSDVIGVPIRFDLADSLELAVRLHPKTQRVYVVVGKARFDAYWEAEARSTFRAYESKIELIYLAGLPMAELLNQIGSLPDRSLVFYLHVFEDGDGGIHIPADVLTQLSAAASAPVYGHVDSYIGRGIVGGRVFSFAEEGKHAAQLGLRVLAGEKPEQIGIQPTSKNGYMFDWRQLSRWNISEASLPPGSIVRYKQPSLWELYRWRLAGIISVCILQALLITGLIVQKLHRRRADEELRQSRSELQELTGKLLGAQETECRRIARELHDDFGQGLALLSVELDLLRQRPPENSGQLAAQVETISTQVKQLSSSMHELSHQLHPMKLEQLGLVAAVLGLCKELTQSHGLHIDFVHDQIPPAIPQNTALCLYRITQEGLRNVIRHSRALQVTVELRSLSGAMCLRIRDDGIGFDPSAAVSQSGLGLVSMRERVRMVNGEITIESQPSGGTRIDARVPLCATSQAAVELRAGSA